MGCGVAEQVFNLVFLIPLALVAIYNSWSSLSSFSFSADVSSIAVTAGAVSTAVAAGAFSALLAVGCCRCGSNECILGILCAIASIVDVLCYAAWCWYGTIGNFCTGASSLTGKVSSTAASAFSCDKGWITFAVWAWLGVSGSLQLSIAFSAVNCRGNTSAAYSLRKRRQRRATRTVKSDTSADSDDSNDSDEIEKGILRQERLGVKQESNGDFADESSGKV